MAIPPVSALVITTPYSQAVTSADFNAGTYSDGVANEVWFKYVSDDDQVFALSSTDPFSVVAHVPLITIFAADGTTVLKSWSGVTKGAGYEVTNGTTYYVRIQRNSGGGAADQNFT